MTKSDTAQEDWQRGPAAFTTYEHYRAGVTRASDDEPLPLRSIYWKVFLLFRDLSQSKWPVRLADARSAYDSMRSRFKVGVEAGAVTAATTVGDLDPLSDAYAYASQSHQSSDEDRTLRAEITQDVLRCMPELDHFRDADVQDRLSDILFVYAKLNPDLGYRQGMHELLAPILWVVREDAIVDPHAIKDNSLRLLCDARYVEHDAFALFNVVMQNAKSFYEPSAHATQNPILARIQRLFTTELALLDDHLASHLTSLQLLPQVFLLRWIRLLFAREFSFDDLLTVWDILFAESPGLELVDQICLILLLQLRWELIDADHNTALTLLLKYPDLPFDLTPRQLAVDAVRLRRAPTATTARALIKKYSGKEPNSDSARLETLSLRTPGREHATAPRFPFSPPRISPSLTGNLEALLQDAAKTVYSRGETWGINKAVRGAVDEVRKGVHEISSMPTPQAPRLQAFGASPRSGSGTAARLEALQQRNRDIGSSLQSAIDELWDFQRQAVECAAFGRETVEALSAAIARVQFAQVYLRDPSLHVAQESDTGGKQDSESHGSLHDPPTGPVRVEIEPPGEGPLRSPFREKRQGIGPTDPTSGRVASVTPDQPGDVAGAGRAQRFPGRHSQASSFLFGDQGRSVPEPEAADGDVFTLFDQRDEDAFDISSLKKSK